MRSFGHRRRVSAPSPLLLLLLLMCVLPAIVLAPRIGADAAPVQRQTLPDGGSAESEAAPTMSAFTSPYLLSAQVTNRHRYPVQVSVFYGEYPSGPGAAASSNTSRQVVSRSVVFPADSVSLARAEVTLRESSSISTVSEEAPTPELVEYGECTSYTLPITEVEVCDFGSDSTATGFDYNEDCIAQEAPFSPDNEENGVFTVRTASAQTGGDTSKPIVMVYSGGTPVSTTLVRECPTAA